MLNVEVSRCLGSVHCKDKANCAIVTFGSPDRYCKMHVIKTPCEFIVCLMRLRQSSQLNLFRTARIRHPLTDHIRPAVYCKWRYRVVTRWVVPAYEKWRRENGQY